MRTSWPKPESVLLLLTIPATCPGDGLASLGQPGQCAYRLVGLNGDGEVRQCSVGVAENQDNFADEAESPINWSRSSHPSPDIHVRGAHLEHELKYLL